MTGAGTAAVVECAGLTKRFGRTVALCDVDLVVGPGEVVGYLGPNGAGKTTTLRILMGFVRPTAGSARVLGRDAWREAARVHRDVGHLSGEPALHDRLTGREHVRATARLRGQDDLRRAMQIAGRLDLDLDRPARALSKGNRQKLAVVLAFMSDPLLLVLDEPTSGFDPLVQQEFQAMLAEHTAAGGSALLSSHVLGEVQRTADRIAVLRAGRLVAVEEMDVLRARSLHRVRASFADPVAASDFAGVLGLRDLVVTAETLTCSAPAAALDALVGRLAGHRLLDLECTEADLEETFLAFYGSEQPDAA
ncbi:ABC transporter ATP-binding protein [Blastococcus sp. URHD0036]|uniref:ABC transporter ATP-binding protein n=1 Tax=Blastococcus sp. URHD0036 TaxID=1380356 RepID=UPI00068E5F31|nr:ABC transporter ATP-binding protein [Blastococcus sp. URHD0036]